ncbi:MAG: ATP-binding protein [bacterium]|nr:ATP-binding protein [bacterium]
MDISYRQIRKIGLLIFISLYIIGCLIAYMALKKNSDNLSNILNVEEIKLKNWYDLSKVISDIKDSINNYSSGKVEVISPALLLVNNAFSQIKTIKEKNIEEEEIIGATKEIEYGLKVLRQAAAGYQYEVKLGHKNGTSAKELKDMMITEADNLYQHSWAAVEYIQNRIEEKNKGILRSTNLTRLFLIFSIFLGIFIVIIFSLIMNWALSKPIDRLVEAIKFVAKGDMTHEIEVKSTDEIGDLTIAFNQMIRNLRTSRSMLVNKKYIENIIESIPAALIACDNELKIKTINRTCCNVFGVNKHEIIGKHLEDILGVEVIKNKKLIEKTFEIFKKGGVSEEMEVKYDFSGKGEKILNLKIVGIKEEKEVLLLLNDITEKKQLEKQLVITEKMAGIGQLAAGISHEFNNLLAVIRSSAEFAGKTGREEDINDSFAKTLQCVDKGSEIVKNLLSFSRRIADKKEKADINNLIEEVLFLIKTDLDKSNIKVIKEFAQLPSVSINIGQIQQVFLNVIINAKQSMLKTGDRLKITTKNVDGNVLIIFNNNGELINEEHIGRIFDPFFTTKGSLGGGDVGGTGLGLSVSYGIMQSHGGIISVASSQKEGTTFTIKLPVTKMGKNI